MNRIADHPGLQVGEGWYELAYATGDDTWPVARLRVTPVHASEEGRVHHPNADPMPSRVHVRLSASLIDSEGQVERIAGKLLLGPECIHSWQFEADTEFTPATWLDECAERVILDLIRQARGIAAATDAGLLFN